MRLVDETRGATHTHNPEMALYRKRTTAMLNKYLRMSTELGHLPALVGREFFRSHVSHYRTHTFEDTYIYVHDMERCLNLLCRRDQIVIAVLFFQQYTMLEACKQLGVGVGTIFRWQHDALDALSAILLQHKLLRRVVGLPIENLELHNEADPSQEEDPALPPKKEVRSVKVLHAVAVSA